MSFRIEKASNKDPERIDIKVDGQELKNVKKYGNILGKLAEGMGIAKKIKNEDGTYYYVNIRSLGRVWTESQATKKNKGDKESNDSKMKLVDKMKKCFEKRVAKFEAGENLIKNSNNSEMFQIIDEFIEQKTASNSNEINIRSIKETFEGIKPMPGDNSNLNKNGIERVYLLIKKQYQKMIKAID